jgi:hypothetical protein
MDNNNTSTTVTTDNERLFARYHPDVPYRAFNSVLAYLASIGIVTSMSCCCGLKVASNTSMLSDAWDETLQSAIKDSVNTLSFAVVCFMVSLAAIVPVQILYTNTKIKERLTDNPQWGLNHQSFLRAGVGLLAWVALMSELATLILMGEALALFGELQTRMVRYGIIAGSGIAILLYVVGTV